MRKDIIKCCCIGARRQNFVDNSHISHQKYLQAIENLIEKHVKNGVRCFVCTATSETELDFAKTVLKLRETYPDVELEIDLAFQNPCVNFSPADMLSYRQVLSRADTLIYLFNQRDFYNKAESDCYMVDNSFFVIAVWDGSQESDIHRAITYAREQGKQVDVIPLSSF